MRGWLLGIALGLIACAAAHAACPGPAQPLLALGGGAWWLPGADGDSEAPNHGLVSNRWLVRRDGRVWLVGSGPSPATGRALACQLRALGLVVTDLVNPWARPELVLGNTAWPTARRWAHADVAAMMGRSCAQCEQRLRLRLGPAQGELGPAPIALPQSLLNGDSGRLGPFDWWRLWRAPGVAVTVLHLRGTPFWSAPGLLWGEGPPDLRDTELVSMQDAIARLTGLPAARGARWLPEQGPWLDAAAPAEHAAYLAALAAAVRRRQAEGGLETDPLPALTGLPPAMARGLRPGLNWQRAWLQLEETSFAPAGRP